MEECTLIVLDEGLSSHALAAGAVCCPAGPQVTRTEE